ncbi:Metallophosphoesterase family protein [uncultured Thiomicrorhabdus sp.]
MTNESESLLEKLKQKNPDWGRIRLSNASGIPPTTVQRWLNKYDKQQVKPTGKKEDLLDKLGSMISEQDLAHIIRNVKESPRDVAPFQLSGDSVKFGIISDTHIGHKKFNPDWLFHAYDFFDSEGCDFIYHAGDIVEGMSGRDGQIYELNKLGFEDQVGYAAELIEQAPMPMRAILGNHDQWFKGKANIGACVGAKLEACCDSFTYLGDDEAYDQLGSVRVMLRHPGDGKAYALSYKGQKFCESLAGGQKPHIVINGHYHTGVYFEFRNIHFFEGMTLQGQSKFQRGRNLSSTPGVWCIEIFQNDEGLQRIKQEVLRFYE